MSNVLEWINEKIITDKENKLIPEDVKNIMSFSLLWNLFESLCCNKNASISKISKLIDKKINLFNENDYIDIFNYFMERYQDNTKFNKLNLLNGSEKLVKKVLKREYTDKNNKLKFIMYIIYRYRNNLFHGEKDMRYIKFQKENFEITNKFLMRFIEKCKG